MPPLLDVMTSLTPQVKVRSEVKPGCIPDGVMVRVTVLSVACTDDHRDTHRHTHTTDTVLMVDSQDDLVDGEI